MKISHEKHEALKNASHARWNKTNQNNAQIQSDSTQNMQLTQLEGFDISGNEPITQNPNTQINKQEVHLELSQAFSPNLPQASPHANEFEDAVRVVYSTLCIGSTYTEQHEFLLLMNEKTVSEHAFYQAEEKVKQAIEDLLTRKLLLFQYEVIDLRISLNIQFVPCFDGAYSHARNSAECVVDVIHPEMRKIFALSVLDKQDSKRKDSDYTDSSKAMEITLLKDLLLEFKDFDLFSG